MGIAAIDHVQIAIPIGGESLARRFYGDLLGLIEKPKPPVMAKRGGAWFEKGNVKIHLGAEADFKPAKKAHVCFIVDDLHKMDACLKAQDIDTKFSDEIAGTKRFFTADPFGNRIEFMEAAP